MLKCKSLPTWLIFSLCLACVGMVVELAVEIGNVETCLDVGREVALAGASVWGGGAAGTAGVGVTGGQWGVSVTRRLLSTCRCGRSELAVGGGAWPNVPERCQWTAAEWWQVGVSSEPGSLRGAGWEKV